jgi:DNA/RNA endonuclease YhcR with UshA esterase domain
VKSTLPMLMTDAARATHIVGLVDQVRGFEDVKLRNVERYRAALKAAH